MKFRTLFFVAVIASYLSTAELKASPTGADVHYSLDKAPILLPYTGKRIKFSELTLDVLTPVVIYLHGCGMMNPYHDLYGWGEYIAQIGFLVILPDSFARPSRRSNCDDRTKSSGTFPAAHQYRQQEIDYVLAELKNLKNADQRYIFLMGHSEGGVATANTRRGDFRGLIISGWSCTCRGMGCQVEPGILAPRSIPALAIVYTTDPWFIPTLQGRCSDWARGRDLTQIDIKGYGHDTWPNEIAKNSVFSFLKQNTQNHILKKPVGVLFETDENETEEPLVEFK